MRWRNLGAATAVVAAVAVVVAWPRLTAPGPRLPSAVGVPLVEPAAPADARRDAAAGLAPWAAGAPAPAAPARVRTPARRGRHAARQRATAKRERRVAAKKRAADAAPPGGRAGGGAGAVVPAGSVSPPLTAPPASPPPPGRDPAQEEFGIEGG